MNKKYKNLIINEILIILFIIIIYIISNSHLLNLVPSCIINNKFNILCPSCGATRCVINIFKFNFINAFLYNPLIFILIIYFVILNFIYIYNTVFNKKIFKFLFSKNIYWLLIIFIIIFTIVRNIL